MTTDPAIVEAALREFTKPRMHTGMSLDATRGNLTAALEAAAPLIAAKALQDLAEARRECAYLRRKVLYERDRADGNWRALGEWSERADEAEKSLARIADILEEAEATHPIPEVEEIAAALGIKE